MTDAATSPPAPDASHRESVGGSARDDLVDAEDGTPVLDRSAHRVVAVLVCHDGGRWVERALAAVAALVDGPDQLVAIDTGSTDQTSAVLAAAAGPGGPVDRVVTLPAESSFAAAANAGVAADPVGGAVDQDRVTEWVWLLHDDSAPDPQALTALLSAAHHQPSVSVLGPKVVGWEDPRRLLEVGVSIGSSGRRETGLERREQDQGQHDGQRDVLAVGSAGMLVRRDLWDQLGGMDPQILLFRDDVDLGWRANAAGHRVVVVTDAVIHHAEAAARGQRELAGGRPHRLDRASALYVLLVDTGTGWLALTWLRLLLLQVLRALALLLGKAAAEATDELAAARTVLLRPGRVRRGRRARRGTRTVPRRAFRSLFPAPGQQARLGVEWVGGLLATGSAPELASGAVETGPVDEDSDSFGQTGTGVWRRRLTRPAPLLVASLLVLSLVAWRGLYRGGPLHGGALLPLPTGASDLWHGFLASWHPVGAGSGVDAPTSLAVLGGWAVVLLGHAGWAAATVLALAVPVAGWAAWVALGPLRLSARLRVWASVVYALSPALLSGVSQGRLGTAVAAVGLPFVGLAAARTLGRGGVTGTVRSAAAGSLLLAVVLAFAPVLWVPVVVLGAAAAGWAATDRAARGRVAAMVVVPVVLLLPWSLRWFLDPAQLFLESGLPLTSADDAPWTVLLLDPGGPVAVPLLLSVGLLVAAVASFARVTSVPAVRAGLVTALVGLVWGLVLATVTVTPASSTVPVVPWPGPALVLATAGLVVAASAAARRSRVRLASRTFSWQQPAVAVVTVLAVLVPVAAGSWWVGRGAAGPVQRSDPNPLPAFVQAEAALPTRARTLVLEPMDGRLGYTLLRDRPAEFADELLAADASTRRALDGLVAEIASGRGGVAVAELSGYAVQFILASPPVDARLEATLDSVPGLLRVANPGRASLWRLERPTGRLQLAADDPEGLPVLLPSGVVDAAATVPTGTADRLLTVSETRDSGWRASLDGRPLPAQTVDDWAQGFVVPAEAGTLELTHRSPARVVWLLGEAGLVLAAVVIALPSRRRDDEVAP